MRRNPRRRRRPPKRRRRSRRRRPRLRPQHRSTRRRRRRRARSHFRRILIELRRRRTSPMRATSFISGFILAFAITSAPALVHAQDDAAEAKKQFLAGTKAFSNGKFAEAATAFEAAAALKPNA